MTMNYEEAAEKIINEAIKSAVFIDENALEPYSPNTQNTQGEAERSVALYTEFKESGVSLSIFKYSNDNYDKYKNYLFENRDLVLLDWKLEGDDHDGEKSLDLLSEIVNNQQHIHFCVIYTNEDKNHALSNILSFFSNTTRSEYEEIRLNISEIEEDVTKILPVINELSLSRFKPSAKELFKSIRKNNFDTTNSILQIVEGDNPMCSLIKCGVALSNGIKSSEKQPCPSSIDSDSHTLCINNTIITILNKKEIAPSTLLKTFEKSITTYKWGIMRLIGLEFHNIQKKKCSFIDGSILNVTKEALGYHKSMKKDEFDAFLKDVMLEQESLNLRNEKLFLVDVIEDKPYDDNLQNEYVLMNVFYNAVQLNYDRPLTFGDVFMQNDSYYLCITALCDCIRPQKRGNKFYFVKGKKMKTADALETGDAGFVSFLNEEECVRWNTSQNKDNVPTYIIPENYLVPNSVIKGGKLTVLGWKEENGNWNPCSNELTYITTLKQNYTQRIANHAFSHPVRVGIDYVKKN